MTTSTVPLLEADPRIGEVYLAREEIHARVEELGAAIAADYKGREPVLVASLKTALVFVADLSRALPIVHNLDFIALAGYAPDFMAESVIEGLTVGYCLALTQFVMVFALGIMYLRRADRDYDPLAQKVVDMAERGELAPAGRFEREPAETEVRR